MPVTVYEKAVHASPAVAVEPYFQICCNHLHANCVAFNIPMSFFQPAV